MNISASKKNEIDIVSKHNVVFTKKNNAFMIFEK